MPNGESRKVLAVVEDLFFTVKIHAAAQQTGVPVEFVKSAQDVIEKSRQGPLLIIFDLNFTGASPLKLIAALKAAEGTRSIPLIGYLSHVQGELKLKAQEAGCNMVLPRSAFSHNLPQILKRHSGAP
jgi:CheY-like chemotaxis protein